MKKKALMVLILLCFVTVPALTLAQAKPDDAKAWVQKGIEFYKANGKGKALAAFSDAKGQFVKDDLYIYVLDLNGKILAHPKAELVGQNHTAAKGGEFLVQIVKTAKEKGSGWVDYKWENPKTKVVEPKTVYFEKVDDMIICSGAYKK